MTHKPISTIGSTEKIDFPGLGFADIPAKVDTGADSSAIWATNIALTPDGLRFRLFGEGSRYYTGQTVTVADYRTALVKNSSGTEELRYKVRLSVRVGDRTIRAWFNLSDRSKMRYPALLGRRLLKGKFLVDVRQRKGTYHDEGPARVLILSSSTDHSRMQALANELGQHMATKTEIVVRSYTTLLFEIATGNVSVRETTTQVDLADFDLVYFKSHRRYYEFAVAAARYLAFKGVPFFDQELSRHVSYDKLSELVALALAGVPVPHTFCASSEVLKHYFSDIRDQLGMPVVCKEINSDRGRKNYLLPDQKSFVEVLHDSAQHDFFLVQQYIQNEGYVRAYVFGRRIGLTVARSAVGHADSRKRHLNNPAGSKNAQLMDGADLPPTVRNLAIRASILMNRQIAGVDLIQDSGTGQWFVLEVNNAPQLASGSYVTQKSTALAKFIDMELNR